MVIHHKPRAASGHKWEYWVLRVTVANNRQELIDWLLSRFGCGYSMGISKDQRTNDTFQWRADSRKALPVLRAAFPYLLLKRRQAELAFEFLSTYELVGRRGPPTQQARQTGLTP